MLGVAAQAPEILVLIAADAAEHGSDAAAEMRHVHHERRMAVEHAAIDQPGRGHDQREFTPDRPRRVVGIELLREIQLERRMHENEPVSYTHLTLPTILRV